MVAEDAAHLAKLLLGFHHFREGGVHAAAIQRRSEKELLRLFGIIQTAEHEEAFGIALSNALNDAKLGENGTLLISSGLLFLLVALYYNIEISSPSADAVQYKDRLLTWSEKYQI